VGVRERVQRAIESPVAEAEKLLAEAPHAKRTERLTILMTGWFRGIAGALDELAIELEALRAERSQPPPLAPPPHPPAPRVEEPVADDGAEDAGRGGHDEPDPTLAELAERARTSREQTEALRAETPEDSER
jgi:hypothetical protein